MIGMENDATALVPVSVTRSQQQLAGYGQRGCSCDPVSFLHI